MPNRPLYTIGIMAELLSVHPETIRVWERYGLVKPHRRSGKRFYSENDLKRLQFVQKLAGEGLNLPAISHYLKLYPCWQMNDCPGCMHRTHDIRCAKPCWKEEGVYCEVYGDKSACKKCEFRKQHAKDGPLAMKKAT